MIFGRKPRRRGLRLFFATDIHGSERCFRKWLNAARAYDVQALVLGGDVTGKALVPIVQDGDLCTAQLAGEAVVARTEEELAGLRRRIADSGRYSVVVDAARAAALDADEARVHDAFHAAMAETLRGWVALADERLAGNGTVAYMMLGNDDPPFLADALRTGEHLHYAEDGVWRLPDGRELVSCGYSTPTPWHTDRELPEERLAELIEDLARGLENPRRAIFNLHCPPRDTHLDQAPRLDDDLRAVVTVAGMEMCSVGSSSVREAIERWHPVLGLHGHVHESPAAQEVGGSLCINPGSEYGEGVLRGALVELESDGGGIRNWQIVHA